MSDLRIDKVAPIRRPALWNRQCMRAKQELFGCPSVRGFSMNSLRPGVGDVEGSQFSRAAASSAGRSILIIPIMACMALG